MTALNMYIGIKIILELDSGVLIENVHFVMLYYDTPSTREHRFGKTRHYDCMRSTM